MGPRLRKAAALIRYVTRTLAATPRIAFAPLRVAGGPPRSRTPNIPGRTVSKADLIPAGAFPNELLRPASADRHTPTAPSSRSGRRPPEVYVHRPRNLHCVQAVELDRQTPCASCGIELYNLS